MKPDDVVVSGVGVALSRMAAKVAPKPLVVFFDEVDCLGGPTLITFLRQLRNGKIDAMKGVPFPTSIALIGMRDIRERGTHLDSLMERMKEPRVRRVVEPVMTGADIAADELNDDIKLVLDMGLLRSENGALVPANQIYSEIIGRYHSFNTQERMKRVVPETPWVKDGGLDMQGLLLAFQDFLRENAEMNKAPFEYNEAYPHIVLQAFLQRVIKGGGQIIREMALGKGALDLGVVFRGGKTLHVFFC